jgi:cyclic beta-1,2-glucan synthetase
LISSTDPQPPDMKATNLLNILRKPPSGGLHVGTHRAAPPRSELYSLERLEEYARELALEHRAATGPVTARPLLVEARQAGHVLEQAYTQLSGADRRQLTLMPGDEWLLDNYHVVHETVVEVTVDLPRRYYLQLPRLARGAMAGYPRVYEIVRQLILRTDGAIDVGHMDVFLRSYQSELALTVGELWAAPAMLRLALVQSMADLAEEMIDSRRQFDSADSLADRILGLPSSQASGAVRAVGGRAAAPLPP